MSRIEFLLCRAFMAVALGRLIGTLLAWVFDRYYRKVVRLVRNR